MTAEDTSGNESDASNEVSDSPDPFSQAALQFDGTNDHVSLGSAAGLGATNFTLEAWIKKTGAGATVSTGANGLTAVPLITKGRHDQDGTTEDTNYFFGLDATGHIAVDFEDFAATNNNHPFTGSAVVSQDDWHHVAATYDGNVWRLYLDGSLDATSPAVNATPRFDSTEHAAIATSLDDAAVEVPEGFFQGQMDEVRIWNVARTPAQIAAAYQLEIPSATGLLGRYSMNEGLGTAVGDSSGTPQNGTTVGGPAWVQGYTFQVGTPNDPPVVDSVTINQASPHTNDTLSVTVTSHDPNNDPVNYSYQWSKDNVDISGATGATLNMATAGNGGKGDAIRVRVVANDGLDDSAPVTSSPVTVLNTIPVASVSIDDTTPGSNDVITATATSSDLDGDTVTLTYVWRVNNVVRQTTSNSSSLTDTFDLSEPNHGNTSDAVTVTVTPNDGEQNGNAATSATATVQDAASEPNRLPELTWQTNDRVKDILRIGNTVYIAGNFTQIRSNNGAQTLTRNRLAAFDALTGNPLPWNPNANGNVEAITASPDGSIIYAGGVFKRMGGAQHQRVAAIDASTGAALVWNPFVDAAVKAIATQGNTIYLGGAFVNVNGYATQPTGRRCGRFGQPARLEPERQQPGPRPRVRLQRHAPVRRRSVHQRRRQHPEPHRGAGSLEWRPLVVLRNPTHRRGHHADGRRPGPDLRRVQQLGHQLHGIDRRPQLGGHR